jgi:hypothetical protein
MIRIFVFGLALTAALSGAAAEGRADQATTAVPNESQPEKGGNPPISRQELETKFKATLTEATMSGRWCSINKGKLGPEKEDKYTIVSISKVQGDSWVIRARIQYGKVDMVAPIPVQVKWAGDTPVIVVDKLSLGEASYSARILVYDKTYAGTWSGGDHGGLMNGVIAPTKKEKEE